LREIRNRALRNLKDVGACSQLPVLASIPLFEERATVRRRKRVAWLVWSVVSLAGIAVMFSSVAHYYLTRV
jgi:hypothetical protein